MRVADRHKGKVGMAVSVRGGAGHSSAAPTAVNAVTYAARLIAAIDKLGGGLADAAMDPGFGVPHATLSVGPIRGGVSTNIVPDACSFEFELRYLPGQDPEPVLEEVRPSPGGDRRLLCDVRRRPIRRSRVPRRRSAGAQTAAPEGAST
jgi:acetylornithine deacetylase